MPRCATLPAALLLPLLLGALYAPAAAAAAKAPPNSNNFMRVRLEDHFRPAYGADAFLFRGGQAINATHQFAYKELTDRFRAVATAAGLGARFPAAGTPFTFVSVSLLTESEDDPAVVAERAFFDAHPALGELVRAPMGGLAYEKERGNPTAARAHRTVQMRMACVHSFHLYHAGAERARRCPATLQPRDFSARPSRRPILLLLLRTGHTRALTRTCTRTLLLSVD